MCAGELAERLAGRALHVWVENEEDGQSRTKPWWVAVPCVLALLCAAPCWASRTVRDETGRTVTVPDDPRRVVCLAPSLVDDVFSIGGGAQVVAITDFTRYPPEALTKPSVGEPIHPSLERVLAFHPDLVLAMAHGNDPATLDKLRQLGIPVYMTDPHGMAGVLHTVESVGDALNRGREAEAEVHRLTLRIDAVKARVQGKPRVRVFMPISVDPVFTVGQGAFITELIADAGGASVTADLHQEWPQISLEVVIARQPEALLLVRGGHTTLAGLRSRPGWKSLQAVRAGKVFFVDERVEDPSPEVVDALEDLARQFHP